MGVKSCNDPEPVDQCVHTSFDQALPNGRAFVVSGGGDGQAPGARVCGAWLPRAEVAMPQKLATACAVRTCPKLRPCPDHVSKRASRQARGYDRGHELLREQWAPKVERGAVRCARCNGLILPGTEWALDHTDDRSGYLGPSHASCNNRAGGLTAHR